MTLSIPNSVVGLSPQMNKMYNTHSQQLEGIDQAAQIMTGVSFCGWGTTSVIGDIIPDLL